MIDVNGWDFPMSEDIISNTSKQTTQDNDISNIIYSNLPISNEMTTSQSPSFNLSQNLLDTKPLTSSLLTNDRNRSPKHFFSPLKPRLHPDLGCPSSPSSSQSPTSKSINAFQSQQQQQQKPKQYNQNYNGPDVFVANALASSSSSSYHNSPKKCSGQNDIEPLYASVQKPSLRMCNEGSFQV